MIVAKEKVGNLFLYVLHLTKERVAMVF